MNAGLFWALVSLPGCSARLPGLTAPTAPHEFKTRPPSDGSFHGEEIQRHELHASIFRVLTGDLVFCAGT